MLEVTHVHTAIFQWWRQIGRVLPWREKNQAFPKEILKGDASEQLSVRETAFASYFASALKRDPYKVVVAELMLQQTQVDRVLPKFEAWMKRWPTTADLAAATLAEVLIFWQGLGYNRRAKFLWQLAKTIEDRKGVWPTTEAELLDLPGIGKYTARAVMSFAMGQQVGVVDTNIRRVIARVQGIEWTEKQVSPPLHLKTDYFKLADEMLPAGQADPWNQAIMDLGALVCVARIPRCEICPIQHLCQSNVNAQEHGWENYAEWIKETDKKAKLNSNIEKKKRVKFTDSDRFFRGRMMDLLRVSEYEQTQLAEKMEVEYGLLDKERFQKILSGLASESMITVKNGKIKLGS